MSEHTHNTRWKRKVADAERDQVRHVQGMDSAAGPSQQNKVTGGEPEKPPPRMRKMSVRPPTPSNSDLESVGSEVGSLGDRIVEAPQSPLPLAKKLRTERKVGIATPIRNESTVVVIDSSEDDSEVEIIPNDSTSEIRSPTQEGSGVSMSAGFIVTHESGRKFVVIGDIRSTGRSSQMTLLLPVQSSYYQGQRVRKYLGPGGARYDLEDLCVASTSRGNQTEEIDHSEGAETDHRASATDNQREIGEGQAGENITGPEGNAENEGVDNTAPENNENETEESSGSEDMADEDAVEGKSGCSVM